MFANKITLLYHGTILKRSCEPHTLYFLYTVVLLSKFKFVSVINVPVYRLKLGMSRELSLVESNKLYVTYIDSIIKKE